MRRQRWVIETIALFKQTYFVHADNIEDAKRVMELDDSREDEELFQHIVSIKKMKDVS